jgi:hypothetical protein
LPNAEASKETPLGKEAVDDDADEAGHKDEMDDLNGVHALLVQYNSLLV